MAQKEELLTERQFHCHYLWMVNWEPRYASSKEVKPQETKAWLEGRFDQVNHRGGI